MERHVLLITYSGDHAAGLVADAIHARGFTPVRLDTDRFPVDSTLVLAQGNTRAPSFMLHVGGQAFDLGRFHATWYRRFYSAQLPPEFDERYAHYTRMEVKTLLSSLFAAMPQARWVDPIPRVHHAHHKVLQLEMARAAGFTVPDTLITNDPAAARAFWEKHGGSVVTKMFNAISFKEDGTEQMVFTSRVEARHLEELDSLRWCPGVFQEHVEKDAEFRVVVVGRRLLVAEVDSRGTAGAVDWRAASDELAPRFRPSRVPPEVEEATLRLMDAYGLRYGALDILRTPEGRHVFLELNAAGEWAWLHQVAGLPIPEALADELTRS